MNKWHKESMLVTAIEVMKEHSPALEDYVRHNWEKYVRRCVSRGVKVKMEDFYERVPDSNMHLKRRTKMQPPYTDEMLDELEEELKKVAPKENPKSVKKD